MNSASIVNYPGLTFGPGPTYPTDPWMPPGDTFPLNPQPFQPPIQPIQPYWHNPTFPSVPSWWPEDNKTPKLTLCTTCLQMHHSETCPFCIRAALSRLEQEIGQMSQQFLEMAASSEKLVRQMDALLTLTVEQKPRKSKKATKAKPQKTRKSKKAKKKS